MLFNTIVENATSSLGNNLQQGISIGDQSLPVFETADFSNNTAIAESSAIPLSYIYDYVPENLNGTVNIDNNYVDPTQLSSNQGKFLNINQGGGPYSGTDSRTGNVNMMDGSLPVSWNGHLAPTVLLTAPTASSTVSGSAVTLSATASDNISVTNVQFEVDGTKIGSALTSPPYTTTWDSTGSSNGVHTISAVAKDSSGNYATSSASVVVSNSVSYTGPGDIVSGADAWWGLRAYGAATAGTKAIRLARASDGAQENISTLSNGNLDTSTAATFCASTTCTIITWYDQTGNGFDVTQTATSSEATYTVNCLGSLPCATLPGGTGYSSSGNMTQAQPLTYSVMYDRTLIQEYELVLDNNRNAILGTAAAANQAQITAGSQVTATSTDNVWHAMQGVLNGSSSFFYIDGTQTNVSLGGNYIFSTPIVFLGTASKELVGMATEGGVWGSAFSTTTASSLNSNQHAYWAF